MQASDKDSALEQVLTDLFHFDRKEYIESDTCVPPTHDQSRLTLGVDNHHHLC